MPTPAITLEYAPVLPKRSVVRHLAGWTRTTASAVARWSWRNRTYLAAALAFAIAGCVVALSWHARVLAATPVFGGCSSGRSQAQPYLFLAACCLPGILPAWWVARRNWWSVRLARDSFAVAVVWFVYVNLAIAYNWVPWRP